MSDDGECEECEAGAPAWLATFADLMSLLMCFFVLLLSFSEMDIQKFKQVAGSMDKAFGIQRLTPSDTIPRGTSVVMEEFSPGVPQPTPILEIKQQTDDDSKAEIRTNVSIAESIEELFEQIEAALQQEIADNILEVLVADGGVMIRVREKDAFPSGSARLQSDFTEVLDKMQSILNDTKGRIVVAGHTDSVPIATAAYPSNWVLSAARAASVVHYLSETSFTDPSKIEIRAFADTKPIAPNDTPDNRARNRRIEINITVGGDDEQ